TGESATGAVLEIDLLTRSASDAAYRRTRAIDAIRKLNVHRVVERVVSEGFSSHPQAIGTTSLRSELQLEITGGRSSGSYYLRRSCIRIGNAAASCGTRICNY